MTQISKRFALINGRVVLPQKVESGKAVITWDLVMESSNIVLKEDMRW